MSLPLPFSLSQRLTSDPTILVCHGSRDPRYQSTFAQIVAACQAIWDPIPFDSAQLESYPLSLVDQLITIVRQHPGARFKLIPFFIGGGVHVEVDLPQAITQTQIVCPDIHIYQTQPIGQQPELLNILHTRIQTRFPQPDAWILLGHGSRMDGFAETIAQIIESCSSRLPEAVLLPAFLVQPPRLDAQIEVLYWQGMHEIRILPFFLLPGAILDRISGQIQDSQHQWPKLRISMDQPLALASTDPTQLDPDVIQATISCFQGG